MGRRRSAFPPGPERFPPLKAEYICADHTVISLFACNRAADHTFRLPVTQRLGKVASAHCAPTSVPQIDQTHILKLGLTEIDPLGKTDIAVARRRAKTNRL